MNLENKKQIAIIFLAIGLGLVASVLTANYVKKSVENERNKLAKQIEKKTIDPLKKEIARLRKEVTKLANRPTTIVKQADKETTTKVPRSSLALRTPSGKRAYTVRIDSLSAVGGLINPGDYVDIIARLQMPIPKTKKTSVTTAVIFQNIQILAVGVNLQAPGGYKEQQKARALTITVALTPEECGLMTFVQKAGKLQLLLRSPSDTETEILQTASWSALADYVFEKQGTELAVPSRPAALSPVAPARKEEVKPFIQIFQGGRQF